MNYHPFKVILAGVLLAWCVIASVRVVELSNQCKDLRGKLEVVTEANRHFIKWTEDFREELAAERAVAVEEIEELIDDQ